MGYLDSTLQLSAGVPMSDFLNLPFQLGIDCFLQMTQQ